MALAIVAVVKMVSRISGIGAIITKHEHVAVSNGYGKGLSLGFTPDLR